MPVPSSRRLGEVSESGFAFVGVLDTRGPVVHCVGSPSGAITIPADFIEFLCIHPVEADYMIDDSHLQGLDLGG